MPTFREILKKSIPSKTQRLLTFLNNLMSPEDKSGASDGQRRRNILNMLRDNQRVKGFAQPSSFDMRKYQTRSSELFNRVTSAISRFIKKVGDRISPASGGLTPSARQFRMALERTIERSRNTMIDAARNLINNNISVSQFRETLTRTIRSLHLTSAFLGVRSISNISMNIIEETMARTDKQLSFLDDFTQDIQEILEKNQGLTTSQADRIVNSASKYADAARSTHSNAERLFLSDTMGFDVNDDRILARRILGPTESHCYTCSSLADLGWVELDELVPIGDSECGTKCRCRVDFARASEIAGETLPQNTSNEIF